MDLVLVEGGACRGVVRAHQQIFDKLNPLKNLLVGSYFYKHFLADLFYLKKSVAVLVLSLTYFLADLIYLKKICWCSHTLTNIFLADLIYLKKSVCVLALY